MASPGKQRCASCIGTLSFPYPRFSFRQHVGSHWRQRWERGTHCRPADMELGHWVTGSVGHFGRLSRPGHRVIIWNAEMTKVIVRYLLLDWNHCMSVHAMNFYFYLWLLKILCPENTSSHILSRHLEFVIEQGQRVNWVSGSLDSRVTGSLGHKMWPSSVSAVRRRDEQRRRRHTWRSGDTLRRLIVKSALNHRNHRHAASLIRIFEIRSWHPLRSSVLWRCWLGVRKSNLPVKIEWWNAGVVICLEGGADCLHIVQLMPLPSQNPIISCLI